MPSTTDMAQLPEPGLEAAGDSLSEVRRALFLVRRHWPLVGLGLLLGVGAGLLWLGRQQPLYRATATLMLEQSQPTGGVLGQLAALSSAPAATAEIALLQSRSLAEQVIAAPADGSLPTPENALGQRQLGLRSRVEDSGRAPLVALVRRLLGGGAAGELYARAEAFAADAAPALRIEFPSPDRVRFVALRPGPLGLRPEGPEQEEPFAVGRAYECGGLRFRLEPRGAVVGRPFELHHDSPEDALLRLLGSTRVVETQRNSGVLSITIDDSDPQRAARIANALCLEYFDLNVERNQRRASQTVDFIQSQLETQLQALETAEREVVELQEQSLDSIDVATAARGLIEDLSELEVERLRLDLEQRSLSEALALLAQGDIDALSRLSAELSDPLSTSLLDQLGVLHMQLLLRDLPEGSPYQLLLETRARELGSQNDELALQIGALRETLQAIDDGRPGAFGFLGDHPELGVAVDPLTRGYLTEIAVLEAERDSLAQEFQPAYPPLQQVESRLGELRLRVRDALHGRLLGLRHLHDERLRLVEAAVAEVDAVPGESERVGRAALTALEEQIDRHLQDRLAAVVQQREQFSSYVEGLEQRLARLPEQQRQLASPLRRLETHKEIAAFLLTSLQEAEITRASTVASADFIDPAVAPHLRAGPRVGLTLVFSLGLGLGLGLGLALLRENLRRALVTPSELERTTGLPVLATIPDFTRGRTKVPGAGAEFIALRDAPDGPVAEAYRSLRANLRFALGDVAALRTLAATSCAPGEGKSTTNIDIAWAFASGGRRVLLVDADMRRPSVHRYLGLRRGPGLAEVLGEEADWRGLVQRTENPLLGVLTAGQLRGVAGDALNGARAAALLDELVASFDLVVFDLPPALSVADVETFAHRLDALLLLYRSGGVPAEALELALSRLRQAGAKLVGSILNAFRSDRAQGGDGYYGGYGYEQYAEVAADVQEVPRAARRRSA
jgi:capsular exopolysaccharide synthesis family protein